jgi:ATP-dependent Lon protease
MRMPNGSIPPIPDILPVLPAGFVIYPYMVAPISVSEPNLIKLVDDVISGEKIIGVFARKPSENPNELYEVGTASAIVKMLRMPDGSVQMLLQGISRVRMVELIETEPYLKARIEVLTPSGQRDIELEAMIRNALDIFQKIVSLAPNLPQEIAIAAINLQDPSQQADFMASHIKLSLEERQKILERIDLKERFRTLMGFLERELEILEIGSKIQSQVKEEMEKIQRQAYLREQLKAIQRELGEEDERTVEINELKERLSKLELPEEARKEAERELERMSKMPSASAEYTVSRTYLDWILSLPWNVSSEETVDIRKAKQILDEDHYDLEKPKERILEYIAIRQIKGDMKGPILCFVGPPGVGKTSLGLSIAKALNRKFIRISLGGIRDEAEIRGHRRTYVGALPGRIIQGMRRAGTNNPVFMLDEIDKIGMDFRGDPAAALLEVLDPEQNHSFVDHYLDVPFDLSKVMFITTANVLHTIPPALLDRMEVIEIPGYTEQEKLHIAKRHLIPKQKKENGLEDGMIEITDDAIIGIIRNYTREAGLRNLEREIATICRKAAKKILEGAEKPIKVTSSDLHEYLGPQRFKHEAGTERDEVGVATGLAWTPTGGEILLIESAVVPGKGNLILTGQLGEVMKESAMAALTYLRSRADALNLPQDFHEKWDIHIHVPSGAVPKDGPSAGVTITTSLASSLTKRPVRKEIAMTGEITLRGNILPVGGIRDKILAAHRAGIKIVFLPKENEKDLEEIPEDVKKSLSIVLVEHMDEILSQAFSA